MASFEPLNFSTSTDSWGPSVVPEKYADIPFAPFNKNERIGRAADWSAPTYPNRYQGRQQGGPSGPFSYQHQEDEDSFLIVDTRAQQKTKSFAPRNRYGGRIDRFNRREVERFAGERRDKDPNAQEKQHQPKTGFAKRYGPGGWGRGGGGNWHAQRRWEEQNRALKDASIDIPSSWPLCGQAQFSALQKLSIPTPAARELKEFGTLNHCDKQFDRATTKTDKRMGSLQGGMYTRTTTSEDPVMKELAESGAGNVFATDLILATLMAAPRAVDSWDIIVTKRDGQMFFDKRQASSMDLLTVGETASEAPTDEKEGVNSASSLAREATLVNQAFHKQIANSAVGTHELGGPSPLPSPPNAPVGYRYRAFELSEGTVVVCRCEVDAAATGKDGVQLLSVKAVSEWDSKAGVNWRKSLDKQRGAVLATEIRNNSFKFARWGICALLSGVDLIKLGYVSRVTPKNSQQHTVLGTQQYKPNDLAAQMALNEKNVWGILDYFVGQLRDMDDGKYVILKDPNKTIVRMYSVPAGEEARLN